VKAHLYVTKPCCLQTYAICENGGDYWTFRSVATFGLWCVPGRASLVFLSLSTGRGLCPSVLPVTSVGSEACHAKDSLILPEDESCLVPSFGGGFWGIIVDLCDVLVPSGIVLLSHFCSLAGLLVMYASLSTMLTS
jgi:hypothetical protein